MIIDEEYEALCDAAQKALLGEGAEAARAINRLKARNEALVGALRSIDVYGSDTLSGRVDGPDDRGWQREAVREMRDRARKAIAASEAPEQ